MSLLWSCFILEKIGKDEPLPADKILRLKEWKQDLKTASTITLPRCYYDEVAGEVRNCSLHGFGDSKRAYSLGKLCRATAYVRRFVNISKGRMTGKGKAVERMEIEEIDQAERLWILDSQKELVREPKFKKTKENLDIIEQNSIHVYKGRLENSDLPVEAKYPIILPKTDLQN